MVDISVLIVNYNTGHYLAQCVKSIEESTGTFPRLQIIVVDNNSSDASLEKAGLSVPAARYIKLPVNKGFAAANNIGLVEAEGRYILFLNPDTVVLAGTLNKLLDFMEGTPQAGACGGKILNPDGSVQYDCRYRYGHTTLWVNILRNVGLLRSVERLGLIKNNIVDTPEYDRIRKTTTMHGCFFMVRRQLAVDLGGFDERFFMYGESEDFSLRISMAGWGMYYVPDARIIHYGQVSTDQAPGQMTVQSVRSGFLYYKKHKGWLAGFIYRLGMLVKYSIRILILRMSGVLDRNTLGRYVALIKWLALNR